VDFGLFFDVVFDAGLDIGGDDDGDGLRRGGVLFWFAATGGQEDIEEDRGR